MPGGERWRGLPSAAEAEANRSGFTARLEEVAEKRSLPKEQQPPGMKPELISRGLRGPEGPLSHGKAAHL